MNLVKLASHTVDLDALPESPTVLDVGCRGFDFAAAVLESRPWVTVIAMDPDPVIDAYMVKARSIHFVQEALVGDGRVDSLYAGWSTGEGNLLCDKAPWYAERTHTVPCANIREIMRRTGIEHWDLVKLDCEGSEFGILENWPGPIASQISVEFHDWTGPWKEYVAGDYYERLWAGPLKDYEVLTHELSTVGPGPAWGHWDTVLRLRK